MVDITAEIILGVFGIFIAGVGGWLVKYSEKMGAVIGTAGVLTAIICLIKIVMKLSAGQ